MRRARNRSWLNAPTTTRGFPFSARTDCLKLPPASEPRNMISVVNGGSNPKRNACSASTARHEIQFARRLVALDVDFDGATSCGAHSAPKRSLTARLSPFGAVACATSFHPRLDVVLDPLKPRHPCGPPNPCFGHFRATRRVKPPAPDPG